MMVQLVRKGFFALWDGLWALDEHCLRYQRQWFMTIASIGGVVVFFLLGLVLVATGDDWWMLIIPCAWLFSPGVMALLRLCYEKPFGSSWDFMNPNVMSWSFVLGDFLCLPFAAYFAGFGLKESLPKVAGSPIFIAICLMVGYAVAAIFVMLDGRRYIKADVPSARFSPSKVWHDWAVVPGWTSLLVWLIYPQLGSVSPWVLFNLTLFGIFVVLDLLMPVDPRKQHPEWNPAKFRTVRRSAPVQFPCSG